MKKTFMLWLLSAVLILSGCRSSAPESTPGGDISPEAVFTSAAQTADARLKERFSQPATLTPVRATATLAATSTLLATTTSAQLTPAGTASAPPTTGDRAEFVADVTIPDGTQFAPNQTFAKTWRIQNAGTTTWDQSYALVFSSGTPMNGPAIVNLPSSVAPGGTVDITVNLAAPANLGEYTGYWILKNPAGQIFGVGANAVDAIWVQIAVTAGTPVVVSTPAAVTATTNSTAISQVSLTVDSASATTCPHTFSFTAQFTLNQPANVTYQLEAAVTDPNVVISLPAPSTVALPAGTHSVVYTLSFNAVLNGSAVFHITAPGDLKSNTINFTLNCL